jgi:hypothetical protein
MRVFGQVVTALTQLRLERHFAERLACGTLSKGTPWPMAAGKFTGQPLRSYTLY